MTICHAVVEQAEQPVLPRCPARLPLCHACVGRPHASSTAGPARSRRRMASRSPGPSMQRQLDLGDSQLRRPGRVL